jgi:hypothetical protein
LLPSSLPSPSQHCTYFLYSSSSLSLSLSLSLFYCLSIQSLFAVGGGGESGDVEEGRRTRSVTALTVCSGHLFCTCPLFDLPRGDRFCKRTNTTAATASVFHRDAGGRGRWTERRGSFRWIAVCSAAFCVIVISGDACATDARSAGGAVVAADTSVPVEADTSRAAAVPDAGVLLGPMVFTEQTQGKRMCCYFSPCFPANGLCLTVGACSSQRTIRAFDSTVRCGPRRRCDCLLAFRLFL